MMSRTRAVKTHLSNDNRKYQEEQNLDPDLD